MFDVYRALYPDLLKVKVKWSRYRPGVAQRVSRGIALLFHDRGTRRGWVVSSTPGRTLPSGKTRYQFYRRLGGSQGRSERAENLVHIGIRSRTVQAVVSRYTDCAIRPLSWYITIVTPTRSTSFPNLFSFEVDGRKDSSKRVEWYFKIN